MERIFHPALVRCIAENCMPEPRQLADLATRIANEALLDQSNAKRIAVKGMIGALRTVDIHALP